MDKKDVVYDMVDNDAIFLPGNELHGSEDYLYIIYENPDANDGEGCIEIEIVDRDTLLEIYSNVDGNAERFFAVMPDYFHGKWEYAVPGTDDYKSLCEAYPKADFIFGRDGGLEEELKFIMDWVIKSGTEKIDTDFGCFYCIPTLFNSYRITDMHRKLIRIVGECEKKAIVTGAKNAKSIEELVSEITKYDWLSDDWKELVEGLNLQEDYHSEEEILKHDWCFQIGKHLFFISVPY